MELGIKQLVSVAIVIIVGMMLMSVTDTIKTGISGSISAAVDNFDPMTYGQTPAPEGGQTT